MTALPAISPSAPGGMATAWLSGLLGSATDASPEIPVWLQPFTPEHAITVLVIGAWTALVIGVGVHLKRLDGRSPRGIGEGRPGFGLEDRYRLLLGSVGFLFAIIYHAYWLTPPRFDLESSLPLHLCDVMSVLAPLSMFVPARWLRTLAYFWGIGLSSQGFITPVETAGPDHARFWIFWIAHVQVVGVGLYHVIVGGYRPRGRDVALATIAGLAYLAPVMMLNEAAGLNYGYVGSIGEPPGIVAALGPWPLRVVWMALLGGAGFVLLWLPWWVRQRVGAGGQATRGQSGGAAAC